MQNQFRFRFRSIFFIALLFAGASAFVLPTAAEQEEPGGEAKASEFVAYYFHGNHRCATCRKLEAYSEEAISKGFPAELASEQLVWRPVNTDQAEHKHFVKDFELVTKSLVLVEYSDGEVVRFENLKLVWKLVGDREGFLKYVRDATRAFVGKT